jgi:hypothetical protein
MRRREVPLLVAAIALAVPVGAAAAVDPDDYQAVTADVTVGASSYVGGYIACPADTGAVTGGASWHQPGQPAEPSAAGSAWLAGTTATIDGLGWYTAGKTSSIAPADVMYATVALCAPDQQVDGAEVKTKDLTIDGPDDPKKGGKVRCDKSDRILNGGAFWHEESQPPNHNQTFGLYVSSSAPLKDQRGWYAAGSNASGSSAVLTIVAACLPKRQLHEASLTRQNVPVMGTGGDRLSCPAGTRILTGGALWHEPGEKPDPDLAGSGTLSSSSPTANARRWYASGLHEFGPALPLEIVIFCVPK